MINLQELLTPIADTAAYQFDDFGHQPWIATNETESEITLETIKNKPVHGKLLVAVSCFFSLNLFSIRQDLDYLLLIDRGDRVRHFWLEAKKIIEETSDRKTALEKFESMVTSNSGKFYSGSVFSFGCDIAPIRIAKLKQEVEKGISWLSDAGRYDRIRSLFLTNRFAFKQIDLCDFITMKKLAAVLKVNKLAIDTLYLSNVREYVFEEKKLSRLYKGISPLLTRHAHLINAHRITLSDRSEIILQRLTHKGANSLSAALAPPKRTTSIKKIIKTQGRRPQGASSEHPCPPI